jgi:hypothetical protein
VIPTPVIPWPGPAHARDSRGSQGRFPLPSKPPAREARGATSETRVAAAFARPSKPRVPTLRGPRGYAVRTPADVRQAALDAATALVQRTATRARVWTRYRAGRPTAADRTAILERLSLDARHDISGITNRLLDGSLTRVAWEGRVRDTIVPRLYAGMLAGTSRREFTPRTRAWADAEVDRHLAYLRRFRTEIGTADQPLNGTIRTRADQYGGAVWTAGQNVQVIQAIDDGYTERKAVLGRADHCSGCRSRADLGWRSIDDPSVTMLGDSPCRNRCHCSWSFR